MSEPAVDYAPEGEGNEPKQADVDPIKEEARKKGWRDKDEYQGEPDQWVEAADYLKTKPLYERIHKLEKHIKDRDRAIADAQGMMQKIAKVSYDRAIADLKKERSEAVVAGDVERVDALDEEMEKVKEGFAAEKKDAKENVAPEVVAWVDKNPWFNAEDDMTAFAVSYQQSALAKGATIEESLKKTEAAVKRAFPEYFAEKPTENRKPLVPDVESGRGRGDGKTRFGVSDLNADQRKVGERFVRTGVFKSIDEYIASLAELGELKK